MKVLNTVIAIVFAIVVLAAAWFVQATQPFYPIVAQEVSIPKYKFVYRVRYGPYKKAWDGWTEFYQTVERKTQLNLINASMIGIYWDNPMTDDENTLRSHIGIAIPEDCEFEETDELKVGIIQPMKKAIGIDYPCCSMVQMLVAIKRIYPKFYEVSEPHHGNMTPPLEIYTKDKMRVVFGIGKTTDILASPPPELK